jgi:hypothetical protein
MADNPSGQESKSRKEMLLEKRDAGKLTEEEYQVMLTQDTVAAEMLYSNDDEDPDGQDGEDTKDPEAKGKRQRFKAKFHGLVADAEQGFAKRAQSLKNKQKALSKRSSLLKKKGEGLVAGASTRWKMIKSVRSSPKSGSNRKTVSDADATQVPLFSNTPF